MLTSGFIKNGLNLKGVIKMKIVEFSDGTYGVRLYWLLGWRYCWLSCLDRGEVFTAGMNSQYFYTSCKGSKDRVTRAVDVYKKQTAKVTVVK